MPSPIPDGKGQPSLTLHRYGVGVDCHSRFFQVCVLIPKGTEIVKLERKVPALWPELRTAKAGIVATLREHGIDVSPSDLRYTCESTGQYHMPLCLAWRGQPAIINPSDTGHVRRKTDRLDAEKLAQHSLHGLWREILDGSGRDSGTAGAGATSVPNWWRSAVGSRTGSTATCSALVMWSGSWGRSTGPSFVR